MIYVIVLVTLSTLHPCKPFSVPSHCGDFVTRAEVFSSQAECERSWALAWWKYHVAEIIRDNTLDGIVYGDTGGAFCVRMQK